MKKVFCSAVLALFALGVSAQEKIQHIETATLAPYVAKGTNRLDQKGRTVLQITPPSKINEETIEIVLNRFQNDTGRNTEIIYLAVVRDSVLLHRYNVVAYLIGEPTYDYYGQVLIGEERWHLYLDENAMKTYTALIEERLKNEKKLYVEQ